MDPFGYLATTAIVFLVVYFIYKTVYMPLTYWDRENVPQLPAWPIIGSLYPVFMRWDKHFWYFLQRVYRENGDKKIFGMLTYAKPTLVVRDLELFRQICVNHFDHFVNHGNVFFNEELDPIFGKGLFMLKDQPWHQMRTTLSPAFTGHKMRGMSHLMQKCGEQLADHLRGQFVEGQDVLEVEFKSNFTKFTNDVIATTAFGLEVDSFKNPENTFYRHGQEATSFRWWRGLLTMLTPWFMKLIKEGFIPRASAEFFENVIYQAMAERKHQGINRPDMLQLLIEAQKLSEEKSQKDGSIRLSDFDIASQAFLFFFAGFEVTATTMGFAAMELAINADVQQKLYEEIKRVRDETKGPIGYEQITKMKYFDAVLTETLRKWPSGGGILDRQCDKDFLVHDAFGPGRDYTIKKGTVIQTFVNGFQWDSELYPEPEKFDPERFYEKGDVTKILTFGIGPRNCIGMRFAYLEMKVALFYVLQEFELMPTAKTPVPIEIDPKSTVASPLNGFTMGLKKRKVLG